MLSPVEAFSGFFSRIVFPDRASTGLTKYCRFLLNRLGWLSAYAAPFPVANLGQVVTVLCDIAPVIEQFITDGLLSVSGPCAHLGHAVDHIADQSEAIQLIAHAHVKRRRGRALFLVSAHMEVLMVGAPVSEAVNQPRVAVKAKMMGLSVVKIASNWSWEVRADVPRRLNLHRFDDIDHPNLQLRSVMTKKIHGGEGLERGHVAAAGHDDIGLAAVIAARPVPNADACGAMPDGLFHREPLRRRLLPATTTLTCCGSAGSGR